MMLLCIEAGESAFAYEVCLLFGNIR